MHWILIFHISTVHPLLHHLQIGQILPTSPNQQVFSSLRFINALFHHHLLSLFLACRKTFNLCSVFVPQLHAADGILQIFHFLTLMHPHRGKYSQMHLITQTSFQMDSFFVHISLPLTPCINELSLGYTIYCGVGCVVTNISFDRVKSLCPTPLPPVFVCVVGGRAG